MTNLTRWEPFDEMLSLSTAMNQLFNNAFVPSFVGSSQTLPIDVVENEDAFIVQAVVPGINPSDLDITVNDQTLTIKGEWKQSELPKGATFHLRERGTGRFERTIQFPLSLNADAVVATYENGILTLTLPKAEAVKPRHISIQNQPRQIEMSEQRTNGQKQHEYKEEAVAA